jgi:hypothetical protein
MGARTLTEVIVNSLSYNLLGYFSNLPFSPRNGLRNLTLIGSLYLAFACFLVGAKGVGTIVNPTAVINSNSSGNGDSSVNINNEPWAGNKLTLLNAYALKLIISESGSYIFRYHRSVTKYIVIPLANLKSYNIIIS